MKVQQTKKQWMALLLAVGAIALCAPKAHATLSITNGDFQNNASGSNVANVDSWFDADSNAQSDGSWWLSTWYGPTVSPNGTSVAGLSAQGGDAWLYQSLGVNDAGHTNLQVMYDVGSFTDAGSARDLGYTLSIYSVDGTYTSAVQNVDIMGATGATLVAETNVTFLSVAPGGNVTGNIATFDISGTSGSELYLRISNNNGFGALQWESIDNISIVESLPPFHPIQVSPTGIGVTNPVTLQAVVVDWGTTFSSAVMKLDGNAVGASAVSIGGTNTISFTTNSLPAGTTHTGMVVVTGADASMVTNEWTFTMGGDPGYGIYIWPTNNPATGADDQYQFTFSSADTNNLGAIINTNQPNEFQYNDDSTYVAFDRDNSQGQLFTTGNSSPSYELTAVWVKHVYYTSGALTYAGLNEGETIKLRIVDPAASTNGFVIYSESLTVVSNSIDQLGYGGSGQWIELRLQNPVSLNPSTQYGFDLSTTDTFIELAGIDDTNAYAGGNGYTTDTRDGLTTGTEQNGDRTFLVQLTAVGPTITPNIQSIVVSGGSATLTWLSESGAHYNILSKSLLTSGAWTTNKSGIASAGDGTTSDSATASTSAEFYQVEAY